MVCYIQSILSNLVQNNRLNFATVWIFRRSFHSKLSLMTSHLSWMCSTSAGFGGGGRFLRYSSVGGDSGYRRWAKNLGLRVWILQANVLTPRGGDEAGMAPSCTGETSCEDTDICNLTGPRVVGGATAMPLQTVFFLLDLPHNTVLRGSDSLRFRRLHSRCSVYVKILFSEVTWMES